MRSARRAADGSVAGSGAAGGFSFGGGGGGGAPGVGMSTMSTPTSMPPRELMASALKVLDGQRGFSYSLQSHFVARCEKHALEFLLEVAATDTSQSVFVVRLQLLRGEATLFRESAARLLPALKLPPPGAAVIGATSPAAVDVPLAQSVRSTS